MHRNDDRECSVCAEVIVECRSEVMAECRSENSAEYKLSVIAIQIIVKNSSVSQKPCNDDKLFPVFVRCALAGISLRLSRSETFV